MWEQELHLTTHYLIMGVAHEIQKTFTHRSTEAVTHYHSKERWWPVVSNTDDEEEWQSWSGPQTITRQRITPTPPNILQPIPTGSATGVEQSRLLSSGHLPLSRAIIGEIPGFWSHRVNLLNTWEKLNWEALSPLFTIRSRMRKVMGLHRNKSITARNLFSSPSYLLILF